MPLTMPIESGGDFEPAPAGSHAAACYAVIDLGTQEGQWQGEKTRRHKIRLSFELPFEKMEDGRPFSVHQWYTFSSHANATFRQHLEGWRGLRFEEKDFGPDGFDVRNLLNKGCTLTITHSVKPRGTFANIDGIGPLMKDPSTGKRVMLPAMVNPLVFLGLTRDTWDQQVFASLPQRLQETIKRAPEYDRLFSGQPADQTKPATEDNFDDEIPF